MVDIDFDVEGRFWRKVDMAGPLPDYAPDLGRCWLWMASLNNKGYGQLGVDGHLELAHRVVYGLVFGPIPEGLTLDHLCKVPACVNPYHLEAVTHRENVLRGTGWAAVNAAKTHCNRGHEYTPENTYVRVGPARRGRECRTCKKLWQATWIRKNRSPALPSNR